jgi:bifunctional DNA-binding transcriptional regulator/antitoxin component of YhaV-PrlF toxin-antitoxin module
MAAQFVKILAGGRLVIPARFGREMGTGAGDTVIVEIVDGELRARSLSHAIKRAQRIVGQFVPAELNLANELIADRKKEVDRERGVRSLRTGAASAPRRPKPRLDPQ